MANIENLKGRKFDPVAYEQAFQKARREVAARRGEPPPAADEGELPELPELPGGDDEVVVEFRKR